MRKTSLRFALAGCLAALAIAMTPAVTTFAEQGSGSESGTSGHSTANTTSMSSTSGSDDTGTAKLESETNDKNKAGTEHASATSKLSGEDHRFIGNKLKTCEK